MTARQAPVTHAPMARAWLRGVTGGSSYGLVSETPKQGIPSHPLVPKSPLRLVWRVLISKSVRGRILSLELEASECRGVGVYTFAGATVAVSPVTSLMISLRRKEEENNRAPPFPSCNCEHPVVRPQPQSHPHQPSLRFPNPKISAPSLVDWLVVVGVQCSILINRSNLRFEQFGDTRTGWGPPPRKVPAVCILDCCAAVFLPEKFRPVPPRCMCPIYRSQRSYLQIPPVTELFVIVRTFSA